MVPSSDGRKVSLAYINSDGYAKSYQYGVPQFGGQMKSITREWLASKYEFFEMFAEASIVVALILKILLPNVVRVSVSAELETLQKAISIVSKLNPSTSEIDRRSVLIELSMKYSFTLIVIHSCGSHRDYFNSKINDGKSSTLENKICFRTKHL